MESSSDRVSPAAFTFPLEPERLLIRPLRLDDAEPLHELYSDAAAMRHLTDAVATSVAESRAWVQSKIDLHERDDGFSLWAIVERASGRVIGDCGLQRGELEGDGTREIELACRLVRGRWGEGFAHEASRTCLDAARDRGLGRMIARTAVENERALRTLERLGLRFDRESTWEGRKMALYVWRVLSARDVHELLDLLGDLRLWLDGGWGVDALLGRQTREHSDLDIAIDRRDVVDAVRRLQDFDHDASAEPGLPARYVMRDGRGRQIDFHVLAFDEHGDAWQSLPDGTRGRYPAHDLRARGVIAGREVRCISAELQRRHHSAYELSERDIADVRLLSQLVQARA